LRARAVEGFGIRDVRGGRLAVGACLPTTQKHDAHIEAKG
jgi:hypothetical protein